MEYKRLLHARISCFADEIDESVEKQTALLKELGIRRIEFRSGDGKGVADYTQKEVQCLREKLSDSRIGISALGSPIGKIDVTEDFEPHYEKFCRVAELEDILGTDAIRMFSFYIPQGETGRYQDEVMHRVSRLVEYAGTRNLVLLHENEKGIYGDNAGRCLELMREFCGVEIAGKREQ